MVNYTRGASGGGRRTVTTLGPVVPYQVSLQRDSNGNASEHFCGGAIIRPNWILASAHCFDDDKSLDFIIHYGAMYADKGNWTMTPGRLILHPNYRSYARVNNDDLALIRTNTSLRMDYGYLAYPIQVSTSNLLQGMVNVSGWPIKDFLSTSQHESIGQLQTIQVPILPPETCYPMGLLAKYYLANMFCVGVEEGKLYIPAGYSSAVQNGQLVGLECGQSGRPGLYISVAKYYGWIEKQIELVEQEMKKK